MRGCTRNWSYANKASHPGCGLRWDAGDSMTAYRILRTTLASVVAIALPVAIPVVAAASSHPANASQIPTRYLTAKGGTVTWSTTVHNTKPAWCTWSSSPKVAGFNTTVKCKTGKVSRSAKVRANVSTNAKDYMLTLTVRGKSTVDRLKVVEAGELMATKAYLQLVWKAVGDSGLAVTYTVTISAYDVAVPAPVPSGVLTISAVGIGRVCAVLTNASTTSVGCSETYTQPGQYHVAATLSAPALTATTGPFDEQVGPTSETLTPTINVSYLGTSDLVCGQDYCSSFSATLSTSDLPQPAGSSWSPIGDDVVFLYLASNQQWEQFDGGSFKWADGSSSVQVTGPVPKQTIAVEVEFQFVYTDTLGESIILGPETVVLKLSPPLW